MDRDHLGYLINVPYLKEHIYDDIKSIRNSLKHYATILQRDPITPNEKKITDFHLESLQCVDDAHPIVMDRDESILNSYYLPFNTKEHGRTMWSSIVGVPLPYRSCIILDDGNGIFVRHIDDLMTVMIFSRSGIDNPKKNFIYGATFDLTTAKTLPNGTEQIACIFSIASKLNGLDKVQIMVNICDEIVTRIHYLNDVLSRRSTESSYVPQASALVQSRIKKNLPPLPEIRIIKVNERVEYIPKGGAHASPRPHDRRGTWCLSKLGKSFWRKESEVFGGSESPRINIVHHGDIAQN